MTAKSVKWLTIGARPPSEQQSGTRSGTAWSHQANPGGCAVNISQQMTEAWVSHYYGKTAAGGVTVQGGTAVHGTSATGTVEASNASPLSGGVTTVSLMQRLGDYLIGAGSSMNPLPVQQHGLMYFGGYGAASDQAALQSDWQQAASDFNVVCQTNNFIKDWLRLKHEQSATRIEPESEPKHTVRGSESA